MEINILVDETLQGEREVNPNTYMVVEMILNMAMKRDG